MELKEIFGEELTSKISASQDETIKAIVAELGKKKLIIDNGEFLSKEMVAKEYVPKHDFNEKVELVKSQKEQLKQHEEAMNTLKTKAIGNEELTKQITQLQADQKKAKEEFETQQAEAKKQFEIGQVKIKKEFAIKEGLMAAGVNDESAREILAARFNLENVEIGADGKVKGFDTMIKPFKENKALASMFGVQRMAGHEHERGNPPEGDYYTREQISGLSKEQMLDEKVLAKVHKSLEVMGQK